MKRCPYCAEEIQDAAIVCKHCGRDITAPLAAPPSVSPPLPSPPSAQGNGWVYLLFGLIVLGVLGLLGVLTPTSSPGPSTLTPAHLDAVRIELSSKGLTQPTELDMQGTGFIRAEYVLTDSEVRTMRGTVRQFGERHLIAIREALLPFGFTDYRVNVNGPPPGTGLIKRYGAARFFNGGSVEWITP